MWTLDSNNVSNIYQIKPHVIFVFWGVYMHDLTLKHEALLSKHFHVMTSLTVWFYYPGRLAGRFLDNIYGKSSWR